MDYNAYYIGSTSANTLFYAAGTGGGTFATLSDWQKSMIMMGIPLKNK